MSIFMAWILRNVMQDIVKRAAPYNPTTKICRLCICEKFHILFHPEDATLNQRSEFFSRCWHKDTHLLANNQKVFLKNFCSLLSLFKIYKSNSNMDILTISFLCNMFYFHFCNLMQCYLCNFIQFFLKRAKSSKQFKSRTKLQVRQDNVSGLFEGSKRHKNGPTD